MDMIPEIKTKEIVAGITCMKQDTTVGPDRILKKHARNMAENSGPAIILLLYNSMLPSDERMEGPPDNSSFPTHVSVHNFILMCNKILLWYKN
jgi:hypothetical protein